jgi:hypothetical protein
MVHLPANISAAFGDFTSFTCKASPETNSPKIAVTKNREVRDHVRTMFFINTFLKTGTAIETRTA